MRQAKALQVKALQEKPAKPSQGDTLGVYWGEFLVSPVPLELSLNYCSHKCAYCFANLNNPGRWADVKRTMRLLAAYQERDTVEALLLREGYPVLISNRVDPFAASNYQQALPIIAALNELGIPIAFQTKGGRGIDEVLSWLPPSCWYVSISFLDDDLRRKIEPGAPSIQDRLALIETLRLKGHRVVAGVNPLVEEWLPDPTALFEELTARGVEGVWIEHFHLNRQQLATMTERERQAIGPDLTEKALKKTIDPDVDAFINRALIEADACGLEMFSIGQPFRSDFFKPYREIYPKTFPILQDFINECVARDDVGGLLSFEDFERVLLPRLPSGVLNIGHYLGSTAHNIFEHYRLSNWMTYRQLLGIIWREYRAMQCPVRIPVFAFAAEREGDEWVEYRDEEDLPYLVFDPRGFDDFYQEVREV